MTMTLCKLFHLWGDWVEDVFNSEVKIRFCKRCNKEEYKND